jgi:micrococcal nuclease
MTRPLPGRGLVFGLALLALVVALALLLARSRTRDDRPGRPPPGRLAMEANASVVEVVDGDTLVVDVDGPGADRESLRLIGIDTPESVATDRPNECFGKEASSQLADLVPEGTPLHVERDVEARDRYDRLLAYVYRASDGAFVNHDLVAHGFAVAKPYPPNITLQSQFQAAEAHARREQLGLWSACGSADVPVGLAGAR